MFIKSYLEKCKKAFNNHNLTLYKGLYPICRYDQKERMKKGGGFITEQQLQVCDLLLKKKILFVLEYKIIAHCFGHFYCDIMVQGKYHQFCLEIDGKHHYLNKKQIIRDLKKEIYLVEHHNIITERIDNDIVNNYYFKPKALNSVLKRLKINLFKKTDLQIFMSEKLGDLKCEMCKVKNKKN